MQVFHEEMDTWQPARLPERFRPRAKARSRLPRRRRPGGGVPPLERSWRPLALTIALAIVVVGLAASLPNPSSPPRQLFTYVTGALGVGPTATPAPHQPSSGTSSGGTPAPSAATGAQPTDSPSPVAEQPSPTPAQGGAGSSPAASPSGLLGLPPLPSLPPLLPTPTPPPPTPPAPTPTPKHCIIGIICL